MNWSDMSIFIPILIIVVSGIIGAYCDEHELVQSRAAYWTFGGFTGYAVIFAHNVLS